MPTTQNKWIRKSDIEELLEYESVVNRTQLYSFQTHDPAQEEQDRMLAMIDEMIEDVIDWSVNDHNRGYETSLQELRDKITNQ